jgi:cell volume regulation protein A
VDAVLEIESGLNDPVSVFLTLLLVEALLAGAGVVIAAVLIFVARPVSAVLCLRPFGFGWGESAFVGWVGLRGGVPIYLAIMPVLSGVPGGELGFAAVFVIVMISLVVQGWTIGPAARLFGISRS